MHGIFKIVLSLIRINQGNLASSAFEIAMLRVYRLRTTVLCIRVCLQLPCCNELSTQAVQLYILAYTCMYTKYLSLTVYTWVSNFRHDS